MITASILRGLLAALLLATITALVGYDAGKAHANQRLIDAAQEVSIRAAIVEAQAELLLGTLHEVTSRLANAKAELLRRQAIADTEMAKREQLQQQLDKQAQERTQTLTKVGHEDPNCTDLAGLPVCPAVAKRLWGEAYDAQAPSPAGAQGR
ncbi:hypothetical protein [Dyella sp. 20L07]|uniref:hypothetical protein n=1 Tax=Dyella sp. 20L07 TaxID=3384240 RepID=UPI003D2C4F8E